jgi:hypothetical protein
VGNVIVIKDGHFLKQNIIFRGKYGIVRIEGLFRDPADGK